LEAKIMGWILVLAIAVPIVLILIWGIAYDVRQRRRREPLTDHSVRKTARETRVQAEGKGTEWGL